MESFFAFVAGNLPLVITALAGILIVRGMSRKGAA